LDIIINALAALWFAVREETEPNTNAAVWILNPAEQDLIGPNPDIDPLGANFGGFENVQVYRPRHLTSRIIAQSGCFTVHPLSSANRLKIDPLYRPRYLPVEEDSHLVEGLTKIEIPSASFSDLRDGLERHGVSDLSMFPDLDGVARYIRWNNTYMKDEIGSNKVLLKQT
jgi:hypothetical protein